MTKDVLVEASEVAAERHGVEGEPHTLLLIQQSGRVCRGQLLQSLRFSVVCLLKRRA